MAGSIFKNLKNGAVTEPTKTLHLAYIAYPDAWHCTFRSSVIQAGTTLVGHVHRISSFLRGLWSTSQPWRCIQVWSTSRHPNVQNDKQNTEQVRHQNQKICPVIDEFGFYFCKKNKRMDLCAPRKQIIQSRIPFCSVPYRGAAAGKRGLHLNFSTSILALYGDRTPAKTVHS